MAREKRPEATASFALTNSWLVAAALLLTAPGVAGQKVRVEEELEAYPTESVDLRCMFVDGVGTKLTQVSWIFEHADGQRDNIAVYHPTYGESFPNQSFRGRVIFLQKSLENPSIRISNLRMSDAGRYTCEYATYPTGNEQGTTTLIMLAKPKNSAKAVTAQAGSRSVMVASCDAVNGKPVATIKWISQGTFNVSSNVESNPDGTVTLRSQYWTVPTPADNGREVSCRVDQKTLERPWIHTVKLSVEYPPTVSIEGYDNNWYVGRLDAVLTCVSSANPPSSIAWTTPSGFLPDTVMVVDNKLMVKKVDYAVNTTFICEARNKLGVGRQNMSTVVIEEKRPIIPGPTTGAIIGGIIGALVFFGAIIGAVFLIRKCKDDENGPPKHKPPPPVKAGSSTEMLHKPSEPPAGMETAPLSRGEVYYEPTGGEPVSNLDDETGGALNGGAAPVLVNDLESSGANIARGESFVSSPMYV